MPHVIIKLTPGRSEQQKSRLAEAIVKDLVDIAKCDESAVSVAIEEIKPEDWAETVYKTRYSYQPGEALQKAGIQPVEKVRISL